jgi:phosphonate transport system substrate-binding protein
MELLRLASCLAENTEPFCRALTFYIHHKIGVRTEYVDGISWQERERLFDAHKIHILWLCGLPYVYKADLFAAGIELLAAPVPSGCRYQGRPIYFSDIIVRSESRFKIFEDLRGSVWAFNKLRSNSGFNVVRAYLATFGERSGFFRAVVESGTHITSVQWVIRGRVDAAAIDSTVLEWMISKRPAIRRQFRIIESIGPSPIPPWVISTQVPLKIRDGLRELLVTMHTDRLGRRLLARGRIARFVPSQDSDYDPIRRMAWTAEHVSLSSVY